MKNKIFIALLTIFPSLISAQTRSSNLDIPINLPQNFPTQEINYSSIKKENFSFGVQFSPSVGWMNVKNSSPNGMEAEGAALNFGAGIIAEYKLLSFLGLISGINYAKIGGYVNDNYSLNTNWIKENNYKIGFQQIDIPLNLKLYTPKANKVSYFLFGGVSACFNIASNETFYNEDSDVDPIKYNITSYSNPSRISYQLGVGVDYQILRKIDFTTRISYSNSFTNALNSNYVTYASFKGYTTSPELFPGYLNLSFGLLFRNE